MSSTATSTCWSSSTRPSGGIRTYFALKDGLEEILGRPVDVVSDRMIRNPYLAAHVLAVTRGSFTGTLGTPSNRSRRSGDPALPDELDDRPR